MSLKNLIPQPIPQQTIKIAHTAFPKGNLYLTMRDELGTIYDDNLFCDLRVRAIFGQFQGLTKFDTVGEPSLAILADTC